jgi:hypothetical protein
LDLSAQNCAKSSNTVVEQRQFESDIVVRFRYVMPTLARNLQAGIRDFQLKKANLSKGRDAKLPV